MFAERVTTLSPASAETGRNLMLGIASLAATAMNSATTAS